MFPNREKKEEVEGKQDEFLYDEGEGEKDDKAKPEFDFK